MNGWAELRHERPAPIVIPSEARPIRIALSGSLSAHSIPIIAEVVSAVNSNYHTGVVVIPQESDAASSDSEPTSPESLTDAITEALRAVLPANLVTLAQREPDSETSQTDNAAGAVARQVAALESLEASHRDLAVVIVIGGEPTTSSLFTTGRADLTIELSDPNNAEKGAGATQVTTGQVGQGPIRHVLSMMNTAPVDREALTTWLSVWMERYRTAWATVPGVERLRSRTAQDETTHTPTPPDQRRGKLPRYDYECKACDTRFDVERPMSEASNPYPCPFCDGPTRRVFSAPKLMFKADPRDNRPVWHNHGGYGHSHAPGRGRHRNPSEDH